MQLFLRSNNCTSRDDENGYIWLYPTPVVFGEPGDRIEVCVSLLQWFPILRNLDTAQVLYLNPRDPTVGIGYAYWSQIDIPSGNLSVDDVVNVINTFYKSAPAVNDRLEASFDAANLQFVLKRPTGAVVPENFAFKGSARILGMLGFTGEPPYRDGGGTWGFDENGVWAERPGDPMWMGYSEIRSPSPINFAGPTHAVVETSLLTTNVADGELSSSVLAKLPITGQGYGELQTFSDTNTFSTMQEHEITSLTVRFRDSFGQPISFGELPWNMTLLFKLTPTGVYRPLETNYSPTPTQTDDGSPSSVPNTSAQGTIDR